MAGRRAEPNAKLHFLPVTHNALPDPEPVDHPTTFRDHASGSDLSNGAVTFIMQATRDRKTWKRTDQLPFLIRFNVIFPCL